MGGNLGWARRGASALLVVFVLASGASPAQAATSDPAVAYQGDAAHDGVMVGDPLAGPLALKWQVPLAGRSSYPVVADGRVFVTAVTSPGGGYGTSLYALSAVNGANLWGPVSLGGTYYWSALAYDAGRVYAVNFDGVLRAFDAATGASLWVQQLPGQYAFSAAPTAVGGRVYVGGAGSGGTLYAVDGASGAIQWTASVANGDESSPTVAGSSVYVSYACNQAYAFSTTTGALQWHHTSSCSGGGGKTVAYSNGRVYTRDFDGNLVLDATTGALLSSYAATAIPALDGTTGWFLNGHVLTAVDLASSAVRWSFSGDGSLVTAPIVANGQVVVGSSTGALYLLDAATGAVRSSANVGGPIAGPDEQNVSQPLTGVAVSDGVIYVPTGSSLVAMAARPDFEITASPSALVIKKSSTATISLRSIAGLSGVVSLTVSGVPVGMTAKISPTPVSLPANGTVTATLTVTAKPTATSGTITVQACAGSQCHTATVAVSPR